MPNVDQRGSKWLSGLSGDIAGLISAWSLMRRLPGDTQPLSGIPGGSPDVDLGFYKLSLLAEMSTLIL